MANKQAKSTAQPNRAEIYRRLLDNYNEWRGLMGLLKKDEQDLRRDFLRMADQAKIQKVIRRLHS